MNINKNDIIELDIIDITHDGSGVGKYNNMVIFVPNTAPGDKISAHIIKAQKNYAYGKIKEIIIPSKNRIIPDCNSFKSCGGCNFRHINYDTELNLKYNMVYENIKRIAKLDIIPDKIIGAENITAYRNKMQIPVGTDKTGNIKIGFYGFHSHNIIDTTECLLHKQIFNNIINDIKNWMIEYKILPYNELTNKGLIRHIFIRENFNSSKIMLCLVTANKDIKNLNYLIDIIKEKYKQVKTILLNINNKKTNIILGNKNIVLFGDGYINDELCGKKFKISPLSFYQVNHDMAETLYNIVLNWLENIKPKTILDLYCGIGTIGLCAAHLCEKLIGVEIIKEAVYDADFNAEINNISNAEFICSGADEAAAKLKKENLKADVIIVDPPRKGLSSELINTIVNISPLNIIYVSCNPATLSRDLLLLSKKGYNVQKIQPVDLFPRTIHVETVVLLERNV